MKISVQNFNVVQKQQKQNYLFDKIKIKKLLAPFARIKRNCRKSFPELKKKHGYILFEDKHTMFLKKQQKTKLSKSPTH